MNATTRKSGFCNPSKITVDPTLDEKYAGKILFSEKLAQANEFLAKHPLPGHLMKPEN